MPSPASFVISLLCVCVLVSQSAAQCLSDNDGGPMKVSEQRRQELLQSQLQFSADLLRTVSISLNSSQNVFFSPTSVYNALLLAYFVSAKHTQDSLKEFLHIPKTQDKLDTFGAYSFEKYHQKLRSVQGSQKYQLSSANRVFVSRKQKVRPCIITRFNDEIMSVDFDDNVSTIKQINNWVSSETRNNIKDLLTPEAINANTNLVLVNAAYFRGFWKFKFSPKETRESEFILSDGTTTTATMMTLESKFSHEINENLEAEILELPYEGDDISMFIMLPLTNSASAVMDLVNKIDAETLQNIINISANNTPVDMSVTIPKFSIDQTLMLTSMLESMGVGDLFRSSADLSTLTGESGLQLDTIIHRAKVTVDETGSEAAAATAIFANRFASDSFVADHPFVFFLFHKKSNTLLFSGVFNSPTT